MKNLAHGKHTIYQALLRIQKASMHLIRSSPDNPEQLDPTKYSNLMR